MTGKTLSLSGLRGKKVLLWFYPEADTPGCSLEGRGFRDHQEYYDDNGIQISASASIRSIAMPPSRKSSISSSRCLTDCDRTIALAYGACSEGKAQHAERISFLIDEQGKIARIYDSVDPRDHPAKVLAEILDV